MGNKFFSILISILILILLISCSSPLKIYKATAQKWCLTNKNIKGVNYHILLFTKANYNQLTFDSLKISDDVSIKQINYSVIGKSNTFQQFQKNDTVIISYNAFNNENIQSLMIYFTYKNKMHYLPVNHFIELKKLCND